MDIRAIALLLLLFAWPSQASEPAPALEDLFGAVNESVVLVRTWESMVIARDGIALVPITDLGSGVLISEDGDVLTAAHVVQVADVVRVEFADGTMVGAKVVASDPAADLALLRLERVPEGAVIARLGDSDAVRVGQQIFVIGAPYGLSRTLSVGHVSARHLPGTLGGPFNLAEFFQTDAAIHRGNSGGPMLNMKGEVIGIVSYILSQSSAFEGVGFAVTSNSIDELLFELDRRAASRSPLALERHKRVRSRPHTRRDLQPASGRRPAGPAGGRGFTRRAPGPAAQLPAGEDR
jgi:S1-C subfamily serine protease